MRVLAGVKERELHPRVLDVVGRDQLRLGLDQVEGRLVRLGQHRDEEDHERNLADDRREQEPVSARLRLDDLSQVEATGQHDHAHEGQAHEDLVADHLGRGPQAAEEGVDVGGETSKSTNLPLGILCMLFGCIAVYGALFATGCWIYGAFAAAAGLTAVTAVASILLLKLWRI